MNKKILKGFTPLEIARPKSPLGAQARARFLTGFTLIESLVVVAITVTLLGSLIVYSRGGEAQVAFLKEQATLTGVFLQARSFAIDAFQPTLQPSPGGPDELSITERVCSWGVHVVPGSPGGQYILFRDLDPNWPAVVDCSGASKSYDDPKEAFQVFNLPPSLKIQCVGLTPDELCDGQMSPRDILFIPPVPKVLFSANSVTSDTAKEFEVRLMLADGSKSSIITVTKGGSVNVN